MILILTKFKGNIWLAALLQWIDHFPHHASFIPSLFPLPFTVHSLIFFLLFLLFSIVISTSSSHVYFNMFPRSLISFNRFLSFLLPPWFCHFLPTPPLSFSLCLLLCGLAPQCSRCWQWNTLTHQTLTLFMCLALARCHAIQISHATCQVVHHKVEGAVDAGSLPDELKQHLKQLALSQVQMTCCFFGLVASLMVIIDNMTQNCGIISPYNVDTIFQLVRDNFLSWVDSLLIGLFQANFQNDIYDHSQNNGMRSLESTSNSRTRPASHWIFIGTSLMLQNRRSLLRIGHRKYSVRFRKRSRVKISTLLLGM